MDDTAIIEISVASVETKGPGGGPIVDMTFGKMIPGLSDE